MKTYSVHSIDRIFLKNYGIFSFPENMGKNFSQNLLDHSKQSTTNVFKTEQFKKQQKQQVILIGNKIPIEKVIKRKCNKLYDKRKCYKTKSKT